MMGEHDAGKGAVSRVKDMVKYGKGYDGIRWPSRGVETSVVLQIMRGRKNIGRDGKKVGK